MSSMYPFQDRLLAWSWSVRLGTEAGNTQPLPTAWSGATVPVPANWEYTWQSPCIWSLGPCPEIWAT